jgi:hypothetical protein
MMKMEPKMNIKSIYVQLFEDKSKKRWKVTKGGVRMRMKEIS